MQIVKNITLTENLFQLIIESTELAESFQKPGQYVVISLENQKPIYLVIASNIGDSKWSFLIRDVNAGTKILKELKVGELINVSPAQGKGYPMNRLIGNDIILFSAGTGLAAFYSVIGEILKNRKEYKRVIMLHGSRYESDLPFKEEMLEWVKNDIEVFVTLSKPTDTWAFYEGHVQEILKHEKFDLTNFSALICGPQMMAKEVSELAISFGLNPENIFTNY